MTKGTPNAGQSGTLANGLLAHLCFNDGSLQDISWNNNNARKVGTPTTGIDKDGQTGQSLILNNANYIYLNQFLQGSTNISGSFIFKVVAANTPIMAFTGSIVYSISTLSNGKLGIYHPSYGWADTGIKILDNKYHQLLFISDSTGTNLYLDKKYVGNFSQKIEPNVPHQIYFGKLDIFGGDLNIDEIRFYNRRLTGETSVVNQEPTLEIAEIFTMGANYEVDITPPTFNTINISNVTASSVDLNINCSENATAYYKLYNRGATAPTPADLKTTHDGTIILTANNLITKNIAGLTSSKSYDLYVVAEDTVGNLQALPTKIKFSTISNIVKGTPNEGANGTLGNGLLAHYSFNDGSLADISGNGYNLTQIGTINNTTDKDMKADQAKESTASSYLTSEPKSLIGGTDNAVSMWVYLSNLSYGGGTFFSISDSGSSNILIRQYYATIVIYAGGESSSYLDITTGWHNIVYNKNKLYIDKQLKAIHNPFIVNAFLYLFAGYTGFTHCKLDEIRVYNRALTGDTTTIGEIATGEIAEIFDMGVNYANKDNTYKISEIKFNIDFDKTQLGTFIEVKYLDIKASGGSILYQNPIVKYWTNYDKTVRVFDKEGELFENSTDLYFQVECDGYETSDVIHKELKIINIPGFQGSYNGGVVGYANYTNDNYKTTEARILIPLTNTSFISYKK